MSTISDLKFTESDFVGQDVSSLPDKIQGSAAYVKARLDNVPEKMMALGKFNSLIDFLSAALYPVGSIYLSTVNQSPAATWGGTWVAWGTGRVPVGINTADSDFSTVEKTGGEKTHKLTVTEIPSHSHNIPRNSVSALNVNSTVLGSTGYGGTYGSYTDEAGGGGNHNNLQPYITCYMFKRTA